MKENPTAEYVIGLIETNRRTYRVNAYSFALAISGAFSVVTTYTDDIDNPAILYLQFSAAMLLVGHLIFKIKLSPIFDQAIEAIRNKQKAEPGEALNDEAAPRH